MPATSAGLLMYKRNGYALQFFLGHPGGPYFKNKDGGNWTIPKGLVDEAEDLLQAAQREFIEETGITISAKDFIPLGKIQYSSTRKILHAWAFEGDWSESDAFESNLFEIEWPPKSGLSQTFPELDKVAWFTIEEVKIKMHPAQLPFIERLIDQLELAD